MPAKIEKYKCSHCKREYRDYARAIKHERVCYFNPGSRSCVTCGNFCAYAQTYTIFENSSYVDKVLWIPRCKLNADLEDTGMCNGSVERVYRTQCDKWIARTVNGTYKFGQVFVEQENSYVVAS